MLTSTQTYRPQNLNVYVTFVVEFDFIVEKTQLLRLDRVVLGKSVHLGRRIVYSATFSGNFGGVF